MSEKVIRMVLQIVRKVSPRYIQLTPLPPSRLREGPGVGLFKL